MAIAKQPTKSRFSSFFQHLFPWFFAPSQTDNTIVSLEDVITSEKGSSLDTLARIAILTGELLSAMGASSNTEEQNWLNAWKGAAHTTLHTHTHGSFFSRLVSWRVRRQDRKKFISNFLSEYKEKALLKDGMSSIAGQALLSLLKQYKASQLIRANQTKEVNSQKRSDGTSVDPFKSFAQWRDSLQTAFQNVLSTATKNFVAVTGSDPSAAEKGSDAKNLHPHSSPVQSQEQAEAPQELKFDVSSNGDSNGDSNADPDSVVVAPQPQMELPQEQPKPSNESLLSQWIEQQCEAFTTYVIDTIQDYEEVKKNKATLEKAFKYAFLKCLEAQPDLEQACAKGMLPTVDTILQSEAHKAVLQKAFDMQLTDGDAAVKLNISEVIRQRHRAVREEELNQLVGNARATLEITTAFHILLWDSFPLICWRELDEDNCSRDHRKTQLLQTLKQILIGNMAADGSISVEIYQYLLESRDQKSASSPTWIVKEFRGKLGEQHFLEENLVNGFVTSLLKKHEAWFNKQSSDFSCKVSDASTSPQINPVPVPVDDAPNSVESLTQEFLVNEFAAQFMIEPEDWFNKNSSEAENARLKSFVNQQLSSLEINISEEQRLEEGTEEEDGYFSLTSIGHWVLDGATSYLSGIGASLWSTPRSEDDSQQPHQKNTSPFNPTLTIM